MVETFINLTQKLPNLVKDAIISLLILFIGYFALKLIRNIIFKQLKKINHDRYSLSYTFISILNKHFLPISFFGLFYLTLQEISLHPSILTTVQTTLIIATTVCVAQMLIDISAMIIAFYSEKYKKSNNDIYRKINSLLPAFRVFIWTLATIFILSNLGFDIGAIIAGLGIGGVALALASQGILQDLFSYFAILFDRPFEMYDLVAIDNFMGYVEHIGIKTTRIKALSGEQLILANTDLTNSRLRNFKRMQRRQVIITVSVIYETDHEKLAQIPEIVSTALKDITNITFDIAYFANFGDFSLDYEVIFYVHSNDLNQYRLARHQVNLAIQNAFTQHQLQFAYPTHVNYINHLDNS